MGNIFDCCVTRDKYNDCETCGDISLFCSVCSQNKGFEEFYHFNPYESIETLQECTVE
jgi:hypothetical protein